MPVILYWGEEDFNIDNSIQELKSKVLDSSWQGLNHKKFNEPSLVELIESIETTPMMFGNLLIEVNANNLFLRNPKGASLDEKLLSRLISNIENLNANIYLLFVCKIPRTTGKKVDSVKKITKAVKKVGTILEFPAFKSYEDKKISDWIIKRAKSKDVNISTDNSLLLFSHIGSELRKLDIELEKLKTAAFPDKNIKKSDISELCQNHENIFLMADYWLKGEKSKTLVELDKLLDKSHPVVIIATLQSFMKRWIRIKAESKNKTPTEISKIVNIHEFVIKKDLEKMRNISLESLIKLRAGLIKAEFNLKSGDLQPRLAIEIALST